MTNYLLFLSTKSKDFWYNFLIKFHVDILKVDKTQSKINSIWMNYTGSGGVGGACKSSEVINIGKKNPVLQYVKKNILPKIPMLSGNIEDIPKKKPASKPATKRSSKAVAVGKNTSLSPAKISTSKSARKGNKTISSRGVR